MSLFIKNIITPKGMTMPRRSFAAPAQAFGRERKLSEAMMSLFIKSVNLLPTEGGEVDFDGPYPAKDGGGISVGDTPSVIGELMLTNATSPFVPNREEK